MSCIPKAMCPSPLRQDLILVDLQDPLYTEGVLQTEKGGIITTKDLRVQARHIQYTNEGGACTVFCEGDLLIDYKEWILTGQSFFYDFVTKTGYLTKGRTAAPPWYIGSRRMELRDNGDVYVYGGYLTTSEGPSHDVALVSPKIRLTKKRVATAKDITLMVKKFPLLWLPAMKFDVKTVEKTPFAVQFGWGGFLASYVSVLYHFLDWHDFNAYARLDGFFKHGLGAGIDTRYNPDHSPTEFYTRSYWVHDLAIDTPVPRDRYRYQGAYNDKWYDKKISVKATYDVVSDPQMAAQYDIKDFDLKTAGRTQLDIKRQEPGWIANFLTKVRVNNFQSVNQELPLFRFNWHPIEIPNTGILFSGDADAGFLHYMFSKNVSPNTSFDAGRISVKPQFIRPFHYNWWSITPEIGATGIYYTNSPSGLSVGQAELTSAIKWMAHAHYRNQSIVHSLNPYIDYHFLATPRVPNDRHYIFTINDGLVKVNRFRFGLKNSVFFRKKTCFQRPFWFDIWGNLFIRESVFPDQKAFFETEYHPFQNVAFHFLGGWDFTQKLLDRANPRLDLTFNENLALALEYRYRSAYAWRKADFYNFNMENIRSTEQLLNSAMSDKREVFLMRAFLRMTPDIGMTFDIRRGWNRDYQPPYFEWSATFDTIVFEHWKFNFIYEKRESDTRYSLSLRLDPGRGLPTKTCPKF